MELTRVDIGSSPVAGRVRVSGRVAYDNAATEEYWFDFPDHVAGQLSTNGSPWLACLLPLAVALREPLRITPPVDPILLAGAREVMRVWRSWYPEAIEIPIHAIAGAPSDAQSERREAAFLSGGVDSLFTLLRSVGRSERSASAQSESRIDDIVTVIGFDVPLTAPAAAERLCARHAGVAADLRLGFIDVATNLRSTRWREASWEYLAHGPALAAIALLMEARFRRVNIAATGGYRDLHAWASHPLTDPLFSTGRTAILHDGAAWTRTEKTRFIVEHESALRSLRVCWRSESDANCGSCNKCYRTMATLDLLGALPRCSTFNADAVNVGRLATVYCAHPWDYREFHDIRTLAIECGRSDIAHAATRAMRRSQSLSRRLDYVRRLSRTPAARLSRAVERRMLRGYIL